MALVFGEIAQRNPAAATLEDLYTVPALTQIAARITVANRSGVATSFRIAVAIAGAADSVEQYKAYDTPILGNDIYEKMITANAADVIRVRATLATLSFTLDGAKRT